MLVNMAMRLLTFYRGENVLHTVVCRSLLRVLTRHSRISRVLSTLPSWAQLVQAFAANATPFPTIHPKAHRHVALAIAQASQGIETPEEATEYMSGVVRPTVDPIAALQGRSISAKDIAGGIGLQAVQAVERIVGFTRGVPPRAQSVLWAAFHACMGPLIELLRAATEDSVLRCRILKLAAEAAETHIPFLTPQEFGALCDWISHLIVAVREQGDRVRVAAGRPGGLSAVDEQARYREIRAVVRLLCNVTNRDLCLDDQGDDAGAGQLVVRWLVALVSSLDLELLKYPKLEDDYCKLLAYIMEAYPAQVASLEADAFAKVMGTLLHEADAASSKDARLSVLEAVTFLVHWHVSSRSSGSAGLGPLAAPSAAFPAGLPTRLAEVLLAGVVHREPSAGVAESSADGLLGVMRMEGVDVRAIARSLAGAGGGAEDEITAAVQRLQLSATAGPANFSRQSKESFRRAFQDFMAGARGLLRYQ